MDTAITQLSPEDFPSLLSEIDDPPQELYLRGTFPPEDHTFLCVVGSLNKTDNKKEACTRIIEGCAGLPIVVVSGLALGIDAAAHRAALRAGLPTVAVPGSGLNDSVIYPAGHLSLAHDILRSGGALLSEYEPAFKATRWSFPRRNRIMAGLSHGILLIEAEERSGTLITARLGLEYNREVCAVPGSIFSPASRGTNTLIQTGAYPITGSDDLRTLFGLKGKADHTDRDAPRDLSEDEELLLSFLSEPASKNALAEKSGLSVSRLGVAASSLELKGYITESGGVLYREHS